MSAPDDLLPICETCARYFGLTEGRGFTCSAYPRGIPVEIMASGVDHRVPYEGDHGLTYKENKLPPVSEAQRRAMFAAAAGHSNLGIPKSVGEEFANADPGGKLPGKSKDARKPTRDMNPIDWKSLFTGFGSLMKFFKEEQREPEHAEDETLLSPESVDYSPGIGEKVCGNCVHHIVEENGAPTSKCELVAGAIDPEYWCEKFSAVDKAQDEKPKGRAASVAFVTPDGRALLVRRSADQDNFPGHWAFPGGKCEEGEAENDAARREAYEEVGDCSFDGMKPVAKQRTEHGWDHTTYAVPVKESFVPRLNEEHDDWCWAHPDECPDPMHPKVAEFLQSNFEGSADAAALSKTTREDIGTTGSAKREDMPEGVFLGPDRTYPVKEKRNGGWAYTRKLLEAAAAEARMHGKPEIAHRADSIREREFGGKAKDENLATKFSMSREGGDLTDAKRRARMMEMSHSVINELDRAKRGLPAGTTNSGAFDGRYLALDRSSARTYDTNGYMHVGTNPISKATVNDYYGREINAAMQGVDGWVPLDENRKYHLLRHPDELKKAAPTFNKLPILKRHVAISAKDFDPKLIIGSTGDAANFDGKYLGNTLAFWDKGAIDDIENDDRKELSSAYSYIADMQPGEYEGMPYDGVMRNIKGNHLALVKAGRAGPDVMVNDADPDLEESVTMPKITNKALLRARVIKRLAADSTPEELAEILEATREEDGDDLDPNNAVPTGAEFGDRRLKRVMDVLADCNMDAADRKRVMDALSRDDEPKAEHEENQAEELERVAREEREEAEEARDRRRAALDARRRLGRDETPEEEDRRERSEDARRRLGRDESDEEREERERAEAEERERGGEDARRRLGRDEAPEELKERLEACRNEDRKRAADRRRADDARRRADDMRAKDTRRAKDRRGAKDEPPPFPGRPETGGKMTKEAMDKAARVAADEAVEKERVNQREIRKAEQLVRPWVGELAMDEEPASANAVLRAALDYCGVNTKGMHPDAYRAVLEAQPRLGARQEKVLRVAADAKGGTSFNERFPEAAHISHV